MLDYANILQAGQQLVPNIRQQMFQDSALEAQQAQTQGLQQQQQIQGRQMEREGEFRQARDTMLAGQPTPQAIQQLMVQFPEYAASIKPAFDALDEQQRRGDLTQMASIYSRANAGDYTGAAALLETRIAADRAAGQDVTEDQALLTALRSGDAREQFIASGVIGMQLAAYEPDKFGEVFGKLNPTGGKSGKQTEYDWRVSNFGKAAADQWLATQDTELVAVEAGGNVFNKRDFAVPGFAGGMISPTQGGGDPASMGGVPAPALGENGLPASLTPEQFRATTQSMGQERTVDWQNRQGIPVTVRSVQEARSLPPGTLIRTPDGRTLRVPR